MKPRRMLGALVTITLMATGGCGSTKTSAPNVHVSDPSFAAGGAALSYAAPPAGLPPFYGAPDPIPSVPPGTLFKSEQVAEPTIQGTVFRVMYASRSILNAPVAVTGLVIVPKQAAPAGGYPVMTWGHGTTGLGDRCTPSLDPAVQALPNDAWTNPMLQRGWEITVSDYQGEGTPGVVPYLVGVSAARNAIDIVRAARQLDVAHASTDYVSWGNSEGGQTAMFVLDIAAGYAPELHLKGVVASAPPSNFGLLFSHLTTSPYRYYLMMIAIGLHAGYRTAAPLADVLTPAGIGLIPKYERACLGYVLPPALKRFPIRTAMRGIPLAAWSWRMVVAANDPANFDTARSTPLLLSQGAADEQIPVATTRNLAKRLCKLRQDVELWIYSGQNHAGALAASAHDVIHWIADRFVGVANPDVYAPTGPGVSVPIRCPA